LFGELHIFDLNSGKIRTTNIDFANIEGVVQSPFYQSLYWEFLVHFPTKFF